MSWRIFTSLLGNKTLWTVGELFFWWNVADVYLFELSPGSLHPNNTVFFNTHLQNYDTFYTLVPQKNAKMFFSLGTEKRYPGFNNCIHFTFLLSLFFNFLLTLFRKQRLFYIVYHIPSFLTSNFRAFFEGCERDLPVLCRYFLITPLWTCDMSSMWCCSGLSED